MSAIEQTMVVRCELTIQEHYEACVISSLQLESLCQRESAIAALESSYAKEPSLESASVDLSDLFGLMMDQTKAERKAFSMEVVREALEKIWQAIKNAIGRLIRATKDFFYQLLRGTAGMMKRVSKLREKLDEVRSDGLAAPTQPIVVTGGSRLHMGGVIDSEELKDGIQNGVAILGQTKDLYLTGAMGLVGRLDEMNESLRKVDENTADRLQESIRALSTYPSQISVDMDSLLKSMRDRELPGGKRVQVQLTEYTKRGVPKDMPDIALVDYQSRVSYRERDKVPVPELDALSELLDVTENLVKTIMDSNERADSLAKRYERVTQSAEDLFDRQSVMNRLKEHMHEHTLELLMRFYQMGMPTAIHRLAKYEFAVARATLAYVDDCLDSYEEPR